MSCDLTPHPLITLHVMWSYTTPSYGLPIPFLHIGSLYLQYADLTNIKCLRLCYKIYYSAFRSSISQLQHAPLSPVRRPLPDHSAEKGLTVFARFSWMPIWDLWAQQGFIQSVARWGARHTLIRSCHTFENQSTTKIINLAYSWPDFPIYYQKIPICPT